MLMDKQAIFSDQQAITTLGNTQGQNTYDIYHGNATLPSTPNNGSPLSDFGSGKTPCLVAQVTEKFTSGGDGTLQVQVIQGDAVDGNGNITTGLEVVAQSGVVELDDLVPGYQFRVALTHGITKRYLGVRYVVGTAAMTGGKVTTGFTPVVQGNYPGR